MAFGRQRSEMEVHTLGPDATVLEAARTMATRHVGALVIADPAGHGLGIVTDRDLVVRALATGIDPKTTPVSAIMSRPLVTARDDALPMDVAVLMGEKGVRRIPLLRADGRLAGLLALDDLLKLYGHGMDCIARAVAKEQLHEQSQPPG